MQPIALRCESGCSAMIPMSLLPGPADPGPAFEKLSMRVTAAIAAYQVSWASSRPDWPSRG
jgi:hypothetical protein